MSKDNKQKASYLTSSGIGQMIKYIFKKEKKPKWLQLNPIPSKVGLVYVDKDVGNCEFINREDADWKEKSTRQNLSLMGEAIRNGIVKSKSKGKKNNFNFELQTFFGINNICHFSEGLVDLETIFDNINFDSIESDGEQMDSTGLLSRSNVEKYIPLNDINHLFSYQCFIKTQSNFDSLIFDEFERCDKKTKYDFLAIDTEMVGTVGETKGDPQGEMKNKRDLGDMDQMNEIGRVTIIDKDENIVFDKLVRPKNEVIDYRTKYSGLTREMFGGDSVDGMEIITFEVLIEELKNIIGKDTILIGHGLENDLGALKFYSDRIIDTAYLFLNSQGYKLKLKNLCNKYLKYKIQEGNHDSSEDALCCLRLLKYKIKTILSIVDNSKKGIGFKDPSGDLKCINSLEYAHASEMVDQFIEMVETENKNMLLYNRTGKKKMKKNLQKEKVLLKIKVKRIEEIKKLNGLCYLVIFYRKNNKYFVAFNQKANEHPL